MIYFISVRLRVSAVTILEYAMGQGEQYNPTIKQINQGVNARTFR